MSKAIAEFKGRTIKDLDGVTSRKLPPGDDNRYFPFFLMVVPLGWEFVETDLDLLPEEYQEGVWLPSLRKFKLQPGLNGVKQGRGKNGAPDFAVAKTRLVDDEGNEIVPWNAMAKYYPDGHIKAWEADLGSAYSCVWDIPKTVGRGNKARTYWKCDVKAYNLFRFLLVETGTITQPDPMALEQRIRIQEKRAGRRLNSSFVPTVKAHIRQETLKLLKMKAAAGDDSEVPAELASVLTDEERASIPEAAPEPDGEPVEVKSRPLTDPSEVLDDDEEDEDPNGGLIPDEDTDTALAAAEEEARKRLAEEKNKTPSKPKNKGAKKNA